MSHGRISIWPVLLALVVLGSEAGCGAVLAQNAPTLGVPRRGRIVTGEQDSAIADQTNPASYTQTSGPTLGLPHKSRLTTKTGQEDSPNALVAGSYASLTRPDQAAPRTQWSGSSPATVVSRAALAPDVVRGAVDENYLSGTPSPPSASAWRGGLAASWDWLQRSVHDSGLGQYCEWFHIKTTFESDRAFDEFISPVTNPFFFEDPRALTELRPVFILQNTPKANPLFAGGNIEMFALQARLALNERLSIVMPKLGFIAFQPDAPSPLGDEIGFAEIILGPKLTFWRDDKSNILAAFGVNFEIAAGGGEVFQSTGSGSVVPYLTFGKELLDNLHFLGAIGYRAAFDSDRSDSFFLSLHADYEFYRVIYPFLEVNWFHYTSGGKGLVANFEGGDLFNFGSTGAAGEDIVTLGVGGRVKILGDHLQAGAAFEFPLTKGKDILDWRLTLDLIWRY
ncbi:hypothetical protein HRbin36_02824 [bacterium HR36]|nr:hypothetical protein HRbin36_02824 [bacterium HR36]